MTTFESKASINKPVSEVYQFLADMNNHQQLMPENIKDWSSSTEEAHFSIQNMASLAIKMDSLTENAEIKIVSIENPPFHIELKWLLTDVSGITEAVLIISAELSMMMKMLASGPLQKLANHQTQKLTEILS
ncbi:MAG TPA: SRPBCC family protein [Mucilaginibacter sp.]|nr:SRPBCC family protein [Mucilaginibacter sp.]